VHGRGAHLLVVTPSARGRLDNAAVEKLLGVATNRNLTVVKHLAEKWGDG
jgi:alpha-L-fucosidase